MEFAEVRNELKKKGAVTGWMIDPEKTKGRLNGFRYFRVLQIGKNSSLSDNLSLSGIELYGRITSGLYP